MSAIVVSFLVCLGAQCERQDLVMLGTPMACLTAQPTIAAWLEHERPGWRLARIEGCGVEART